MTESGEPRDEGPPDTVPDKDLPVWCHAPLVCPVCGNRQVSVYRVESERLECGGCGYMMPAPELPKEP